MVARCAAHPACEPWRANIQEYYRVRFRLGLGLVASLPAVNLIATHAARKRSGLGQARRLAVSPRSAHPSLRPAGCAEHRVRLKPGYVRPAVPGCGQCQEARVSTFAAPMPKAGMPWHIQQEMGLRRCGYRNA
jgi:hypothetical protein